MSGMGDDPVDESCWGGRSPFMWAVIGGKRVFLCAKCAHMPTLGQM